MAEGSAIVLRRLPVGELLRFGVVALICGGLYFALLTALEALTPWSVALRAALAYLPSVLVNYLLQRSFTFRSRRHHMVAGPRFVAIQLGGMAINSGGLWVGIEVLGWSFALAQTVSIAALGAFSYLGQKLWAFGAHRATRGVPLDSAAPNDDADRA